MARCEELATRLERANAAFVAAVEGCPEDAWQRTTQEEGWTVAALAHHIAAGHEGISGLVQAVAAKQAVPPLTLEAINEGNAQAAQEHAQADRAEVLQLARDGGAKAAAALRGLDEAALDHTVDLLGTQTSAAQIAENILIGHVEGHLASLRASVQ